MMFIIVYYLYKRSCLENDVKMMLYDVTNAILFSWNYVFIHPNTSFYILFNCDRMKRLLFFFNLKQKAKITYKIESWALPLTHDALLNRWSTYLNRNSNFKKSNNNNILMRENIEFSASIRFLKRKRLL